MISFYIFEQEYFIRAWATSLQLRTPKGFRPGIFDLSSVDDLQGDGFGFSFDVGSGSGSAAGSGSGAAPSALGSGSGSARGFK